MDRASATKTVNSDSIPGWVNQRLNTTKLVFIASLHDVEQQKGRSLHRVRYKGACAQAAALLGDTKVSYYLLSKITW